MPFRINSKQLFLTYPQCNVKKEEALEYFLGKFNVEHYVVAEEKHQNGDDHLHVYLKLKEAIDTRDCRFADFMGFHGKYEGCRSTKNVIKYCTKADHYTSDLDIDEIINSRQSHKKLISQKITRDKVPITDLINEFPELIFGYKKLKEDINEWKRDSNPDTRADLPRNVPNSWNLLLPVDTSIKKCHYWFWSSNPNRGKTTFGTYLLRMYKSIIKSTDFSYWNIESDTRIIILDEFYKGGLKAQQLNSICDGSFEFRIFHGGLRRLEKKALVIVLSNFSIEQVFPYMHDIVKTRFNEFNVD